MKTKQRRGTSIFLWILVILLCALLATVGWILYDNNVDRSGWEEKEGVQYYRDFHGRRVTGWQDIDGSRYYFGEEDNALRTLWQDIDGSRYYFGTDGTMDTGWQAIGENRYYFAPDGTMQILWLELNGSRYYLGDDGTLQTGWQDIGGARYCFDADGVMTTGWAVMADGTYYFDETGAMMTGWHREEDNTFCFGPDGKMLTGKIAVEDTQYYFTADGSLYTGWEDTGEDRYYYHDHGAMALGWTEIDGLRYYFGESGKLYTGWLQQGEYRYYLQTDGSAAVGPVQVDGAVHYFTPKGIEVILVNALNYVPSYYELNLVTVTGWHQVADVCLEPLQRMLADCQAAGNTYNFNSAHRTIKEQTEILEYRTEEYMESLEMDFDAARDKALKTVAVPGTSEHHLGLAVDLLGDDAIAWLTEHCWEYGFIVRYTEEKYSITGIIDEPWHFRYVGTEVSLDMKDSGLCLEEYLGADPVFGD